MEPEGSLAFALPSSQAVHRCCLVRKWYVDGCPRLIVQEETETQLLALFSWTTNSLYCEFLALVYPQELLCIHSHHVHFRALTDLSYVHI